MNNENRRKCWREFYQRKISSLSPEELEKFRTDKARYDAEYREAHAAERAEYKADPERRSKWNAIRKERYRLTRARPRTPLTPEEKSRRSKEAYKQYRKSHPEKAREWRFRNIEHCREESRKKYSRMTLEEKRKAAARKRSNPLNRLRTNLYLRVNRLLKGLCKSARTMALIGCTHEHLRAHISSQFKNGMSWENYGRAGWHVDHIKPCASFDLSDPDQQKLCFHFSNLQPLWAVDNLSKGARLPVLVSV